MKDLANQIRRVQGLNFESNQKASIPHLSLNDKLLEHIKVAVRVLTKNDQDFQSEQNFKDYKPSISLRTWFVLEENQERKSVWNIWFDNQLVNVDMFLDIVLKEIIINNVLMDDKIKLIKLLYSYEEETRGNCIWWECLYSNDKF